MKRRSSQRGAAMVEAGVVLPVLAVFFGVMMLVHNMYLAKLEIQSDTRNLAFSSGAHACVDGNVEFVGKQLEAGPLPKEGDAPDPDKQRSVTVDFLTTRGNATAVAVALGRTKTVTAKSTAMCNPYVASSLGPPTETARSLLYLSAAVTAGMWKMLGFAGWSLQYLAQRSNGLVTE